MPMDGQLASSKFVQLTTSFSMSLGTFPTHCCPNNILLQTLQQCNSLQVAVRKVVLNTGGSAMDVLLIGP